MSPRRAALVRSPVEAGVAGRPGTKVCLAHFPRRGLRQLGKDLDVSRDHELRGARDQKLDHIFAAQPVLVYARHQIHRAKKTPAVLAAIQQAQRANPYDLLAKYTDSAGHFKRIEHALWRVRGKEKAAVLDSLDPYRLSLAPDRLHLFEFFRPLDVGFKVVGTGSVGLRDYVVLMEGNGAGDPLFLQIKQEVDSAYAPYLKAGRYPNHGRRVAEGQRKVQPVSDLLLGWTRIGDHDFVVRQLNDHKGSVDLTQLEADGLNGLAGVAGELLARGHARSGDPLSIRAYIGGGDKVAKAIVHYGLEYAAVAEADFALFKKAIREQKVKIA